MKLVIVGPGLMPIPPKGWGAVESLIWDYKVFLDRYHPDIETHIVNEPHPHIMIQRVNELQPDIVHIQYDDLAKYYEAIQCKRILLTSHYGYLDQIETRYSWDHYFREHFATFVRSSCKILALSPSIYNIYKTCGVPDERLFCQPNGANEDIFRYTETPQYPDRCLYLAKIEPRKRQAVYQGIPNMWFAGNTIEPRFNLSNPRYLGEWTKPHLYENLTDYGNLALLSDGEAHPLVCCEALICGLGLVISEWATANLDLSLPFIHVIPNSRLDDVEYIQNIIYENQQVCKRMRPQIHEYGLRNFSWKVAVARYADYLRNQM